MLMRRKKAWLLRMPKVCRSEMSVLEKVWEKTRGTWTKCACLTSSEVQDVAFLTPLYVPAMTPPRRVLGSVGANASATPSLLGHLPRLLRAATSCLAVVPSDCSATRRTASAGERSLCCEKTRRPVRYCAEEGGPYAYGSRVCLRLCCQQREDHSRQSQRRDVTRLLACPSRRELLLPSSSGARPPPAR